nr:hypothetical protein [Tanacetum cinerariifolium]
KQNQRDVNDAMGSKKKTVVVTSDLLALIVEKTNVSRSKEKVVVSSDSKGSEADDFNDKQVVKKDNEKRQDMSRVKCYNCKKEGHFVKDCKKAKEINANMVFMAQIEKVLSDSEASSSSADEKISEFRLDKHVRDLKNTVLEKDFKISELEERVRNKDLEIEKCLERLNVCENKLHKMGQTNKIVHMIMPSKDNMYSGRKGIGFENPRYFEKAKDLRPTLYDEKQTSSLKPYVSNVILEKIIIDLEDEVVNLLEKEKVNLETIESLKSKGFESGKSNRK